MNVYVADPPSLSIDLCRMQAIGWDPPARDCGSVGPNCAADISTPVYTHRY